MPSKREMPISVFLLWRIGKVLIINANIPQTKIEVSRASVPHQIPHGKAHSARQPRSGKSQC